MSKCWQPNEAKKFARQAQIGKSYYVLYEMATNLAPYEDSQLYSEITFTQRRPFTGTPCTNGSMDAVQLCQNWGPVYEQPPAGVRNVATPPRQVAGPLGSNDYEGVLDEAELRGLEKRANQGSDPRKRRPLGTWRV
ncbi:hypothetical protein SGFS_013140 [Streptomyces graminofaciens]|uniref:Uncharacterized protein n=1 Tax=Streptomyces graminofaciens TaxID=68212 RepID=A0ABM7F2K5_9ACTN|nr:hypothetical protein [Streptomyces graminofaciens]BBC30020.1 hypothetical protein SGFS_013140 [Streptomyces graminofaciens]